MSAVLLWIVGACYVGTAIDMAVKGNHGLALAFVCYAVANYGLILAAKP